MTTSLSFSTLGGVAALSPVPGVGFILQIATLFGAVLVLRAEVRGWTINSSAQRARGQRSGW